MAEDATRLSEVQEQGWSQAIGTAARGVAFLVAAGLAIWLGNLLVKPAPPVAWILLTIGALCALAGAALLILALNRSIRTRKIASVSVTCPYCDGDNRFLSKPTKDFTCECCQRQIHFQNGAPVPVQTIVCQACRAEHRVAVTVDRYVCDKCNRPLRITRQAVSGPTVAGVDQQQLAQQEREQTEHQDVLVQAFDPRREQEVAFRIQDLLLVNAVEARRLLRLASPKTPLIVAHDVAPLKAASLRRQLEELGATASTRPAGAGAPRQS
jgi:transposase-like protein